MKRILSVVLMLLLCAMSIPVLAEADAAAKLDYITDDAGIFSDEELALYQEKAKALSDEYRCGVYFAAIEDYTQIADGRASAVAEYIYTEYDLGFGESRDGVLVLVSVAEGDCAIVSGGRLMELIDDRQLLDECVDAYGDNGYSDILDAYLARMQAILSDSSALPTTEKQALPKNALPTEKQALREARQTAYIDRDGYVTDLRGLLTADVEAALEEKAAEMSGKYGCGVYVIIVDDYKQYGKGSAYDVAGDVFLACDLGEGAQKAGVLLMMSMAERDVTILTNEAGHAMVGPDAKDWLAVKYLKHFKKNNWAAGFDTFLTKLDTVLQMAAEGKPMTWRTYPETILFGVLVALLGGFGISYLLLVLIRNRMKSVFSASFADEYITQGGVNITKSVDEFSHKTTTRRKIETSKSSGGGSGGSRSSDSRGFSGRSDKF